MASSPLLRAHDLHRQYGARAALAGVSLTLARGEVLGLLGLNGAGKSTTLQILAGVLAPHRGTVEIGGHDLANAPLAARRLLGYLPEVPPLFPEATVDEYLGFCAELHGVRRAEVPVRVAQARARCQLDGVADRLIRNLSKGYQQRVGIAQAIVHAPPLVILDEPTVGLDPAQLHEVRALIGTLRDDHAVLLSTHLLSEAESVCSRVAILHEGRLVFDAPITAAEAGLCFTLRHPPPLSALSALFEGATVVVEDMGRHTVAPGPIDDTRRERFVAAAVAGGWGLVELREGDSALERTFLTLTRGAPPAAGHAA